MAKYHRGAPLKLIKLVLHDDFSQWCKEVKTVESFENIIEFLIQKNFIQGKEFLEYCDSIPVSPTWFLEVENMDFLREGFIPWKAWIGVRKGKRK